MVSHNRRSTRYKRMLIKLRMMMATSFLPLPFLSIPFHKLQSHGEELIKIKLEEDSSYLMLAGKLGGNKICRCGCTVSLSRRKTFNMNRSIQKVLLSGESRRCIFDSNRSFELFCSLTRNELEETPFS